ncbi:MAG: hypothetical protein SOT71_08170 [Romboutsia timonensis]|uniref:hypothetical protein n=1 Tax=Romboutsia timonensis TaxID=1776391 RepID=UPI002A75BC89|nr:hypothetical protein [Romboutsia timonensis]MDY2882614.1 hypothetical protein [Romboutsia timonensis]
MTDSLKLFLGNKQVLVETNEIPISNNIEETFNNTDTKQSDINKTFKKEIEDRQKNLVNTDNTINLVDNVDTNNVDISLNIPESEKIILKSQEGLTTNISLNFDSENNELQLKGKNNQLISSAKIHSNVVYRGVFNDIASAKYILADTLANKDVILIITDNKYYQYKSSDNTFNVVDDVNIINNLKSKQDTLSNTDDVKIKDNISVLKDETGNNITDSEGNVIKEVKKNIVIKSQDTKFLGLYKDNTAIVNYKNGDIIYNNNISNYQSFNEKTSSWENYNDLRTLQSIKSYQTAIRIPENSPLQISKRLKEGSTVELEEVLTSSFTRFRYDMDYTEQAVIESLPKTQKYNGDIFRLKDESLILYTCEATVDENYNITETENYIYIKNNRKVDLNHFLLLQPSSSDWSFEFDETFGMSLKNNIVSLDGEVRFSKKPTISAGFNSVFKIDTTSIKEGYIIDANYFVYDYIDFFKTDNILIKVSDEYNSSITKTTIIDDKGNININIYCSSSVANSLNSGNGSICFVNYNIYLGKK